MSYSANGLTILKTSEYSYMNGLILDLKIENKKLKEELERIKRKKEREKNR